MPGDRETRNGILHRPSRLAPPLPFHTSPPDAGLSFSPASSLTPVRVTFASLTAPGLPTGEAFCLAPVLLLRHLSCLGCQLSSALPHPCNTPGVYPLSDSAPCCSPEEGPELLLTDPVLLWPVPEPWRTTAVTGSRAGRGW